MGDALGAISTVDDVAPGTQPDRDLTNPPIAAAAGVGGCCSVEEARAACPEACPPVEGGGEQNECEFSANAGETAGWSEGEHSQDGHLTILPACETPVVCDHAPQHSSPEEQSPAIVDGEALPLHSNGGSCSSSGGQVGLEGLSPSNSVRKEAAPGFPRPLTARDDDKGYTPVDDEHGTAMEADDQWIPMEDMKEDDMKEPITLGDPPAADAGPAGMGQAGTSESGEEPVAMDVDVSAPAADGEQGSSGAPPAPTTSGRRPYVVGKAGRGRGRNRGGVCDGMPRRRSYVRRTAAIPRADDADKEPVLLSRPRGRPPNYGLKRKYVRKVQPGTSGGPAHVEHVEGIIGRPAARAPAAEDEKGVHRLYGCSKCRFLKGGCNNCRDAPIMERDKAVKWMPQKGHPQTSVRDAPTFYPTAEEFVDPIKYIDSIREKAEPFGIACVVPPASWSPPFALEKGTNGQNADSFRFTIRKQTTSHLCMREPNMGKGTKAGNASSRYESRVRKPVVEPEDDSDGGEDVAADFGFINLEKPQTLKSFHSYSDWAKALHYADPVPEAQPEDAAAKRRKLYKYSGPNPSVEEIEAEFWRIVEEPDQTVESLYGQDLDSGHHGSGFPLPPFRQKLLEQHLADQAKTDGGSDAVVPPRKYTSEEREYSLHKWNINNLPRNKGSVLRYIEGDELITGVMVPWLYVGSHMSAFCWHVEDHALYSVNYMHLGAPKVWYGVPADASEALEEAMNDALPHLFETAPDLLYQLVTMVSPVELKKRGVPVSRLVHKEGTFVITFPNAYHAGFNTGFNCAEAVNFGPPDWLPWGSYIVEKYRREQRPATLSMDALLISLVRAAPQVKKKLENSTSSELGAHVRMQLKISDDDHVSVCLPCQDDAKLEVASDAIKPGPDGKFTLSQLDPVNLDDVPPVAVQKGAGELKVRIMEEKRRQEVGLGDLLPRMTKKRMHGKIGDTDEHGVFTNTDDVDCLHCKGDLYLSAVVSRHCPGIAACPEHACKLEAPSTSKVLLYRFTFEELEGFLEEAIQCVPGTKEAIDAAVDKRENPAPKLVIKRLGPIVEVDSPEAKQVRVKRKYTRRIAPEDDLRRVKKGKRAAVLKRRLMAMGRAPPTEQAQVVPAKPARAPYGSVKAAREAAAAAAAAERAAKITMPRREGEVRKSRLKAQEIITSALALADAMEEAEEEEQAEPKRPRKARAVKEEPAAEPIASLPSSPVAAQAPSPPVVQTAPPAPGPSAPVAPAPRRTKAASAARAAAAQPPPRAPLPVMGVPPNLAMYWAASAWLNPGMMNLLGAQAIPGAPVMRPEDIFKMLGSNPQAAAAAAAAAQQWAHLARMAPGAHLLTPPATAGISMAQETRTPPRSATPSASPAGPANVGPVQKSGQPASAAVPSTHCLASLLDPKYAKPLGSKGAAGSATTAAAPRKPAGEPAQTGAHPEAPPLADTAQVTSAELTVKADEAMMDCDFVPHAGQVPAGASAELDSSGFDVQ